MALVSSPLTSSNSFPSGFNNSENNGPRQIRNKRSSSTFNADFSPPISSSGSGTSKAGGGGGGGGGGGMSRSSSTPSFLDDTGRSQSYAGSTTTRPLSIPNPNFPSSSRIPSPSSHSSSKSLSALNSSSRSQSSADLRSTSPTNSFTYPQQQSFSFQPQQTFNSAPSLIPLQPNYHFQQSQSQSHLQSHPHPQYPFIPSPHPNSNQQLYSSSSSSSSSSSPGLYSPGFTSPTNEQQLQMMIQEQHQAMLVQQDQYQQRQWQIEMLRNQQQQNWQQQQQLRQQQAQQQIPRRRATSGPAPAQNQNQPQFSPPLPLPYPPSPSPSLSHQYSNPAIRIPLSSSAVPMGGNQQQQQQQQQQFGQPYPTPPGSLESGGRESQRSSSVNVVGTTGEGYHPYRRGNSQPASIDRNYARTISSSPSLVSSQNPSFRSIPSSSSPMSSYPSSSSNTTSTSVSTAPSSHKRGDSSSSISKMTFPSLPVSNSTAKPLNTPNSSIYSQLNTSGSNSSVKISSTGSGTGGEGFKSNRITPPTTPTQLTHSRNSSRTSSVSSLASSVNASNLKAGDRSSIFSSTLPGRSSSPILASTTSSLPVATAVINPTKKPSPLSQSVGSRVGATTPTTTSSVVRPETPSTMREGREEDEDSDDTAAPHSNSNVVDPIMTPKPKEKKGMAYKLKKAFGSSNSISQLAVDGKGPTILSHSNSSNNLKPRLRNDSASSEDSNTPYTPPSHNNPLPSTSANASTTSVNTTTTTNTKSHTSGKRFGILNSKLNSSTDNISISSTVSSASVMIRKLGQMGKLARRNSLMGLTKAFKKKDCVPEGEDKSGKPDKKSSVATANVSHVTAEIEGTSSTNGISPAAALARKHQLQYAEQEAARIALQPPTRSFAVHARTSSNASSDQASIKSSKSSSGGIFSRSKSTDDIKVLQKQTGVVKKSRWGLGTFGSKTNLSELATSRRPSPPLEEDQTTPRPSVDASKGSNRLVATQYAGFGGFGDDDVGEELDSPTPPFLEDEYEPSLRDAPLSNHRNDSKSVRGILKGAGTYKQEDYATPTPRDAYSRSRANSFDSPHQVTRPGSPATTALVGKIPSEAQLDGLESSPNSPRTVSRPSSILDNNINSPYMNQNLNASAPVLKSATSVQLLRSSSSTPSNGKKISFAVNLSVHSTWPANVYDRKAAEATCNKLTPAIAQRIKEELNSYKMEEMEVHPTSRQLTHFFV